MTPLEFFWYFLKASLFSTGGLGNLPILHQDLIGLGWAQETDFVTAIAVGNLSPGPTGLWSISLGYLIYGWLGAALALLALSLPPLLILVVSSLYNRHEAHPAVQNFTRGLALGVVGLTLVVSYSLAGSALGDWRAVLIGFAALGMAVSKKVPILVILAAAALAGILIYR